MSDYSAYHSPQQFGSTLHQSHGCAKCLVEAFLTSGECGAQVKGGLECEGVRRAAASGGVWKSLVAIGKAEGLGGYWRGNFPQVQIHLLRIQKYRKAGT